MEAIERIKGYCTEVTQSQWEQLVRVADEEGIKVYGKDFSERFLFFALSPECTTLVGYARPKGTVIPFPDFLAKLKGAEKWQPKAGEMVEVSYSGFDWCNRKFIGKNEEYYIVYRESDNTYWPYELNQIRPLTTTITRAEAEALLNKRVID